MPWPTAFNALVYVLAGLGTVGAKRRPVHAGQLTVFGAGDTVTVEAAAKQDSRSAVLDVLILGGLPIGEPVAWHGPFVMNTDDEIRQAYDDFEAGKLGRIPSS
jgi:redox-sensitive bicupin YhaK (pirin superfamily)